MKSHEGTVRQSVRPAAVNQAPEEGLFLQLAVRLLSTCGLDSPNSEKLQNISVIQFSLGLFEGAGEQ